jgi:hypothetical protein
MSRFIQPLERRTLLTASASSLSADLTSINTDAAAVKADLTSLQTAATADFKSLVSDLKGSSKTNLALLAKLRSDGNKYLAKLKADVNALLKGSALSAKGVKDGTATLANPNAPASGNIKGDVNALAAAATNPLTKLTTDASTATLVADLNALAGTKSLSTDVTKAANDLNSLSGKVVSDANKFGSAVNTLKTDLTTLLPQPTTTPSLIGDYKGTLKTKAVAFGIGSQTVDFELVITSQTINSVTGSITVKGNTASGTITATELSNGKLSLKINNSGITVTLNGTVNVNTTKGGLPPGSVISGSGSVNISGFSISGSFTATKVT